MMVRAAHERSRRGITLTEILIAIMILGVGMVSLATLFPIGLQRMREAARYSRTKVLVDSVGSDGTARALFSPTSFGASGGNTIGLMDAINWQYGLPTWWWDPNATVPADWNPLTQDTGFYGDFPSNGLGVDLSQTGGYGLPFAYDPLWRFQTPPGINPVANDISTNGYYLGDQFEARFGSGIGFIRLDPSDMGLPSAHGLQRLTNFNRPQVITGTAANPIINPVMPISNAVPNIFVSQEDVVWVENLPSNAASPVLPDLSLRSSPGAPAIDWHYSWMFTGFLVSAAGGATFEGNIVVFENRPFGISAVTNTPAQGLPGGTYEVAGETVVEAIFGHSGNIVSQGGGAPGYGAGADRTVLLRWFSSQPDPAVKPGDWIADVTYERQCADGLQPDHADGAVSERHPAGEPVPQPAEQCRVGQPAGPAVFLVPGAEGDSGDRRSLHGGCEPQSVAAIDGGLRGSIASGADDLELAGKPGGFQRRVDFALCDQRDSPAVHREVRFTVTPTIGRHSRHRATRRGVTLVEMLVTVAVLVIIMTVMVQIFQAATGALSAAQTIQDLDNQTKLLESTIRSDLGGVTARFTPALDPIQGLGYFEYGENEFADSQGEDSDDFLRFTAKAPPGQPFTGRMWVTQPAGAVGFYNASAMPITVTSEYAEIIYFLRNGNLYRRVLLIAPELQSAIVPSVGNQGYLPSNAGAGANFTPGALGGVVPVSWQGVNDFSAHPAATGPNTNVSATASAFAAQTVMLNSLSSLTNRENRFAAPRFSDDFYNIVTASYAGPDGYSDDFNGDKVPDLYPSLYPNLFTFLNTSTALPQLIFAPNYSISAATPSLAFPYIFPGAYTQPQMLTADQYGWIHSPSPYANVIQADGFGQGVNFESNPIGYLQSLNHNPLDLADNLPTPTTPLITHGTVTGTQMLQTWWGFPTWRETLSVHWNDPTKQVNDASGFGFNAKVFGQPNGLTPRSAGTVPVASDTQLLPWMGNPLTVAQGGTFPNGYDFSIIRRTPQLFSDAQGYSANMSIFLGTGGAVDQVWGVSWEDDLIMTNVRSFDVKAYDNAFGGYADLGWADDLRLWLPYINTQSYLLAAGTLPSPPPALQSTPLITVWPPLGAGGVGYDTYLQTFAHEGRMPPITTDQRFDAQFGAAVNYLPASSPYLPVNNGNYTGNIGDDTAGVVRMRRVWDSWSTAYSMAPAHGLNNSTGFLFGPPYTPPIYPSYPAPYPAPLRGIQIQIRVADPTNQRVKSVTIRQDFTDKL